jgi:hypothetical protein
MRNLDVIYLRICSVSVVGQGFSLAKQIATLKGCPTLFENIENKYEQIQIRIKL